MTAPVLEYARPSDDLQDDSDKGIVSVLASAARDGGRSILSALSGDGRCPAPKSGIAAKASRELATISSYARFVAENPDMPSEHRERFMARILSCSEEARTALS